MSTPTRLRLFYLLHLSKPASDRPIFREIREQKARTILEIGLGTAERALRMIEMASVAHPVQELRYIAIDLFEDRVADAGPGHSLRDAHRLLKATGARVQLIPGTPLEGLSRMANMLGKVDAIVVSAGAEPTELARAWFYIPRLLRPTSVVFLEARDTGGNVQTRLVDRSEVEILASPLRRRAA